MVWCLHTSESENNVSISDLTSVNAGVNENWAPFFSLTLCISYENLYYYPQNLVCKSNRSMYVVHYALDSVQYADNIAGVHK